MVTLWAWRPRWRRITTIGSVALVGLGLSGCAEATPTVDTRAAGTSSVSGSSLDSSPLVLDFDDLSAAPLSADGPLWNLGDRPPGMPGVLARVGTIDAGRITLESGRDGGQALRFPAHDPTRTDRAVLTVTAADPDVLQPEADAFRFGAAFSIDPLSEGGLDNGNNLIQRGLWGQPAQYKIQVDKGVVSCRILGHKGEVIARVTKPVTPQTWYDVSCERRGDSVRLEMLGPDGPPAINEAFGTIGSLLFDQEIPLVIGGKAGADGTPVTGASDQFNGAVDDIRVEIDR